MRILDKIKPRTRRQQDESLESHGYCSDLGNRLGCELNLAARFRGSRSSATWNAGRECRLCPEWSELRSPFGQRSGPKALHPLTEGFPLGLNPTRLSTLRDVPLALSAWRCCVAHAVASDPTLHGLPEHRSTLSSSIARSPN
jgi:hypothetical protein